MGISTGKWTHIISSVGNGLYGYSRKRCKNFRGERELRGRLLIVASNE